MSPMRRRCAPLRAPGGCRCARSDRHGVERSAPAQRPFTTRAARLVARIPLGARMRAVEHPIAEPAARCRPRAGSERGFARLSAARTSRPRTMRLGCPVARRRSQLRCGERGSPCDPACDARRLRSSSLHCARRHDCGRRAALRWPLTARVARSRAAARARHSDDGRPSHVGAPLRPPATWDRRDRGSRTVGARSRPRESPRSNCWGRGTRRSLPERGRPESRPFGRESRRACIPRSALPPSREPSRAAFAFRRRPATPKPGSSAARSVAGGLIESPRAVPRARTGLSPTRLRRRAVLRSLATTSSMRIMRSPGATRLPRAHWFASISLRPSGFTRSSSSEPRPQATRTPAPSRIVPGSALAGIRSCGRLF